MNTKGRKILIKKHLTTGMISLIGLLSGCASFQGGELQKGKTFPQTHVKKSVDVDASFTMYLNGEPFTFMHDAAEKDFAEKCAKRLNKSKMFGDVSTTHPDPDIKVSVAFADLAENNLGEAFLTGLTLYLYPSSHTDNFHLSARITDMRTGRQKDIMLTDKVTMWQQLFLLPLLPFKTQPYEANKCMNNMIDNLCLEIYRTGLLETATWNASSSEWRRR